MLIHPIIFITSTCDQVEYLKLGFNKGPIIGATTEEPYIFCELSTCRTATSGIHTCPTLGLVGHSKKFVALSLLTDPLHSVLYVYVYFTVDESNYKF